eukprot:gene3327-13358_t
MAKIEMDDNDNNDNDNNDNDNNDNDNHDKGPVGQLSGLEIVDKVFQFTVWP